jgi:hypothetical protein
MNSIGIRVSTTQLSVICTYRGRNALRYIPSARCANDVNVICRYVDIFSKNVVSLENTFYFSKCVD